MTRKLLLGALALALAAMLGAGPAGAARNRVRIIDNAYQPKRIEIAQGTRVTWTNRGSSVHTVTSTTGKFDSGLLQPGETYSKRFRQVGVFKYFCEEHPDEMRGKVLPTDV